jgi:type II secretory pathway predicted ATPase ExeA
VTDGDKKPTKITQPMKAHFGFTRLPFSKQTWAKNMFDSRSQRELLDGLRLWTEVRGVALVTGHPGVGKSITLRRFCHELDDSRFRLLDFSYLPNTVTGFLRSLGRLLGLPMRQYASDLFDDAQKHLACYEKEHGPHPVLVLDDAEGLSAPVLDVLRRLTCYDLDAEDRFSLLIAGTDELLATLRHPAIASLRSRIGYALVLKPFGVIDVREYVLYHLRYAGVDPKLFADDAIQKIFQSSQGIPRNINQLAIQALIEAAVDGRNKIDGKAMARTIANHPLYQSPGGDA